MARFWRQINWTEVHLIFIYSLVEGVKSKKTEGPSILMTNNEIWGSKYQISGLKSNLGIIFAINVSNKNTHEFLVIFTDSGCAGHDQKTKGTLL